MRRATQTDMALLMLTAAMWAGAFVGIKVAVPALGPVGVAATRAALGFLVLLPFALFRGLPLPLNLRTWVLLVLMAELNIALPFFLISWAEQTVDAGVASLLMGIGPLFAMIGAHYFNDDDRMSPRRALGVALGFLGVVVLVGTETIGGLGSAALLPQGALIGASLCYVVSGLLVRKIELPSLPLAIYALAIATVTLVPILWLTTGPGPSIDTSVLVAVAFLGIFPTGLAYILRFHLIKKVGYATFALSINLIPVFGVLLGIIVLGERLTLNVAVALVCVLSGLFIARGRVSS